MVSVVRSESFLSLESKGGTLTVEEELDHYRQRFQSMKLVLKELQQQVGQYKTRCAGVDTVALMLKESRQEVIKLSKQRKALETAVANLQNRLSANGLSSSLNIEETEQFVPGASKQTLDNLARENGRLRSLLKSLEAQTGMKSPEELQNMRASLEILEAENNQLRAQMLEFDCMKQVLASQFEEIITKLKEEHEAEKFKLENELSQFNHRPDSEHIESACDVKEKCKSTQPDLFIKVDEIRQILKIVSDQCIALDQSLENVHITAHKENVSLATDTASVITEEAYAELEKKFSQVVQMNQRWQAYNHSQEQQVHELLVRVAELEQINQEGESLRNVVNVKEIENLNLQKEIDKLTREANKMWSQPPFDLSIVEILKQQIQVCTEDFNTERKDREHAVNRVKQLQEEVSKLSNENDILRKDLDNLRRIKNTPEPDKHENQFWARSPQHLHYFNSRGGHAPLQRIPLSLSSSSGPPTSVTSSLSPGPSFTSTSSATERLSFNPSSPQDIIARFQGPTRVGGNRQLSSHGSQEGTSVANTFQNAPPNLSMPTLSRKTESPFKVKNRQTDLTCPRCNKEFTEDQHTEIINHINTCTD